MRTIEQIVTDTEKPGEAILAGLTPEKCELLHGGTLLACELSELCKAPELENCIEEWGDIYYAIEMIERHCGKFSMSLKFSSDPSLRLIDDFLSPIKAHCIYGKKLDAARVSQAVAYIRLWIQQCHRSKLSHEFVIAQLDAKLSKRHPTGYSDKNAIERKDKQ